MTTPEYQVFDERTGDVMWNGLRFATVTVAHEFIQDARSAWAAGTEPAPDPLPVLVIYPVGWPGAIRARPIRRSRRKGARG